MRRVILNLPELKKLLAHRPLAYKFGDTAIEIALDHQIGVKEIVAAALDIRENYSPDHDPPEAREFLPRGRNHRREGQS